MFCAPRGLSIITFGFNERRGGESLWMQNETSRADILIFA